MRRTKEEAEQTRQKVIEAALKLFSRNGYSQTTLAMIAEDAGYSRGPIYWHFRNKDELYEAVLSYSQSPLQTLVEQADQSADPLNALEAFIDEWFRLLIEDRWYRQSFEILLNKTEMTDALSRTIKRERQLTRNIISVLGRRAHELNPRLEPQSHGLLCYTFLMGITQSWLFSPRLFSLADLRGQFRQRLLLMLELPARP
ncbi:MAG: TetR family transcriptional regulator [Alcanivoracaceae bacterium]